LILLEPVHDFEIAGVHLVYTADMLESVLSKRVENFLYDLFLFVDDLVEEL